MTANCEYSSLTLPNDVSYLSVARHYVQEVARTMGFDDEEQHAIDGAVFEAVENVIEHAFEPGERERFAISCERVPAGIRIIVKEKGLPFDPNRIVDREKDSGPDREDPEKDHGIPLMRDLMDEVSIHSLGPEGKEVHLIKYSKKATIEDYIEACELEPYEPPVEERPPIEGKTDFQIRLMRPDEAVEVAKCVYRSYGYSYFYQAIYYPDRMVELNKSGHVISAVAVAEDGDLAGHCSLFRSNVLSPIAEIGQAVVKPEYRGHGCLLKLTEYLIQEGKSRGLAGVFVGAVTNHMFSQRIAERLGFHNCGLKLAYVPSTVSFKGIREQLSQRETFTVDYQYLQTPETPTLYPPRHHRDFVVRLYGNLGNAPRFAEPDQNAAGLPARGSTIEVKSAVFSPEGFASIDVKQYGTDVVTQVRRTLADLCLQRYDAIELGLDLKDPFTGVMTRDFEKLGFFFSGILPGASGGEVLTLQYLNNIEIDYEKINVYSEMGRATLAYVRDHDPHVLNRKTA
jgi:anti-sigma regulatory factor (Ser/Thr protein kinase)/GNAT superfamily N-acetyltransferase